MNGASSGVSRGNQLSLEQLEHFISEKQAELELERLAEQGYVDSLISELDDNNAKYNREEMRFIARDEFDINEKAVVFNRKKAVSIKEKIQSDIKKLISLITEINDGSFEIQDMASDDISNW